jgi:hypothetical protein
MSALPEQPAVTRKRIDALGASDVGLDFFLHALLAVGPFHGQAFALEETFIVGHELGQPLEWGGRFQHQLFH